MAYDESLAARVRGVLSPVAGFSEKKLLLRLLQSLDERLDGVPFLVAVEEEFRAG